MSVHDEAFSELADLLGAISHPDRLKLLLELRDAPRDVASLTAACALSQSRTSQHLGLLKAHHLVQATRDGRRVFYSLVRPELSQWLIEGVAFLETQPGLHQSIRSLRQTYGQEEESS